ncbi:RHG07 protein, partial [Tricholaema leucomelas]|nr:RHG07 protein [Tricholaema leucomelas]
MSVAIRKKSWEEHVSQWMGLALEALQRNAACRHGLPAEGLQTAMEQQAASSAGRKEKCASFPECCYGGELRGCPAEQLGTAAKELDENDNHGDEEDFLEASTETLVHASNEDDKPSALSLEGLDGHHVAAAATEPEDREESFSGAASSSQVPLIRGSRKAAEAAELIGG